MAASQPIALPQPAHPRSHHAADYSMDVAIGSVGTAAPFNPASYTRHFLGTPLSWRTGSFSARFPQGSPSAQCLSSVDPSRTPPLDVMNAVNVSDREGDLCRNYVCCGLHLQDLHALLEHYESVHVRRADNPAPEFRIPYIPHSAEVPQQQQQQQAPPRHSHHLAQQTPSFDTDDMELELDLDNSTQPPPPSGAASAVSHSTTIQQHPYSHFSSHFQGAHPSPYGSRPQSPTSSHSIPSVPFPLTGPGASAVLSRPKDAFNSYACLSADYASHIPRDPLNSSASVNGDPQIDAVGLSDYTSASPQSQQCIPPALLFTDPASTSQNMSLSIGDGSLSRVSTSSMSSSPAVGPVPANKLKLKVRSHLSSSSTPNTPSSSSAVPSTSASTPAHTPPHTPLPPPTATSAMLLSKPFRCPKPNCNKSYKQANGLKYHMTHGSCNFAPPKDLEHVKDLLEMKRRERERDRGSLSASTTRPPSPNSQDSSHAQMPSLVHPAYGDLGAITEMELREVEREAEKRLRPYACGVGDCPRRYKNMNGLRYHYQHSGEHGAVGLALLSGGAHQCQSGNGSSVCDGQEGRSKSRDGKGRLGEEPESRRKRCGVNRNSGGEGGSASVPVSRAGSVSRVGTPQPSTVASFSSGYSNLHCNQSNHVTGPTGPGVTQSVTLTPPLTPLTASVHNLGIRSQPHSPSPAVVHQSYSSQHHADHASPPNTMQNSPGTTVIASGSPVSASPGAVTANIQQQQQHAQMTYHAQYAAELQRRQYMQFHAQWNFSQQHQQQQGEPQGLQAAAGVFSVGMDVEYGAGAETDAQQNHARQFRIGVGEGEWGGQQQ